VAPWSCESGPQFRRHQHSFEKWEGNSWNLGVRIERRITDKVSWWGSYCYLCYVSGDDGGLYCWIGECFFAKKTARQLFLRFQSLNKNVEHYGDELGISHSLKVEEVGNLEEYLDGIMQQWLELWKEVGGINDAL
jgi:hypothetical protein